MPGSLNVPLTPNVDAQKIGGEARREQVHADADHDRIAAKRPSRHRRALTRRRPRRPSPPRRRRAALWVK